MQTLSSCTITRRKPRSHWQTRPPMEKTQTASVYVHQMGYLEKTPLCFKGLIQRPRELLFFDEGPL